MNKKYIIIGIVLLVVGLSLPIIVSSQETSINTSILNMKAIVRGIQYEDVTGEDTSLYLIDANYFIKVSGSPTYTFNSREIIYFNMPTNQLLQINNVIEASLIKHAKDKWNWTLLENKIAFQPFVRGDQN